MEPKSIRAKTTLIYKTELIRDAFELHQQGRSLSASDADRYLLPPALLQQYHQQNHYQMEYHHPLLFVLQKPFCFPILLIRYQNNPRYQFL